MGRGKNQLVSKLAEKMKEDVMEKVWQNIDFDALSDKVANLIDTNKIAGTIANKLSDTIANDLACEVEEELEMLISDEYEDEDLESLADAY